MLVRNEMVNHRISECSKFARKMYETRHNGLGKVIHGELRKTFRFDLTNKWYIHNQESVLENVTRKIRWDFDKQTDHLISARRPYEAIVNKKKR